MEQAILTLTFGVRKGLIILKPGFEGTSCIIRSGEGRGKI
jgi:hypothetical protein